MWPLSSRGAGGKAIVGHEKKTLFCGFPNRIIELVSPGLGGRRGRLVSASCLDCTSKNVNNDYYVIIFMR